MKRTLTVTVVFSAVIGLTQFAPSAAGGPETLSSGKEMKQVVPTPPSCDYTWTGFYIGANVGYGWGNGDTHFEPLPSVALFFDLKPITLHSDPAGVIGGGQIGYNHQWGKFVFGAEADFQGSDMEGTKRVSPIVGTTVATSTGFLEAREKTDWFGTFRLRVGFTPFCRLLVYGTGGLAFGDVNYAAVTNFSADGAVYATSFDKIKAGWTAGGGLEYALNHRWSLKAEYLYYDLGDESSVINRIPPRPPFQVRYDWDTTAHVVRGGLNFKF